MLLFIIGSEKYLINLIDSPGHVDFSSEVWHVHVSCVYIHIYSFVFTKLTPRKSDRTDSINILTCMCVFLGFHCCEVV